MLGYPVDPPCQFVERMGIVGEYIFYLGVSHQIIHDVFQWTGRRVTWVGEIYPGRYSSPQPSAQAFKELLQSGTNIVGANNSLLLILIGHIHEAKQAKRRPHRDNTGERNALFPVRLDTVYGFAKCLDLSIARHIGLVPASAKQHVEE